jgi:hypothetical protein
MKILKAIWQWLFGKKAKQTIKKWLGARGYEVIGIESVTPGKTHAWLNTSIGRIRKEIRNINGHGRLPTTN